MTEEVNQQEVTEQTEQGAEGDVVAAATEVQSDPFEEIARSHGWAPKEEWRGKPEDWVAPRDFIDTGLKRRREGAEELRSLRGEVKQIGRTAQILQQRAVEEARREAETRFADAVEKQDHQGARAAREEISRLDAPQPGSQVAGLNDFMARNGAWFGNNRAATALAQSITAEAAARGVSPDEQLRLAEDAVRQDFPQLFGQPVRPAPKPPASVTAPETRTASPRAPQKTFATLPAEAQRAGQDFLKRGMVKTLEDYAKAYYAEEAA